VIDVLKDLSPYLSVPMLLIFGAAVAFLWRQVEVLKTQQVDLHRDLAALKDQEIRNLERHIEVLKDERVDPERLLSSVELIERGAERERKELRDQLDKALKELNVEKQKRIELEGLSEEIDASLLGARQRLLTIVTHELRSPAIAIRNTAEILVKNAERYTEEQRRRKLVDISTDASLLLRLADTLDSADENRKRTPHPTRFLLVQDVVFAVFKQLRPLADNFRFESSGEKPPPLLSVKEYLVQIYFNLVHNAVKYRQPAQEGRLLVHCVVQSNQVISKVSDWGIGIPEGAEERIFDGGFRAPNALARDVRGMGLGLAVSRRLARSLGGDLKLTRPSNPTEFTLTVPLQFLTPEK
jgi:signal transduction histidine kinase